MKRSSRSSQPYDHVWDTKCDSLSHASLRHTATVCMTQSKAFLSIHFTRISLIYKKNKTSYDKFMVRYKHTTYLLRLRDLLLSPPDNHPYDAL